MSLPADAEVRNAVEGLVDDGVHEVTPLDAGKNAVYEVSLGERRAVLKVGTATPDRIRAEPGLVDFVRDRTGVPVPTVLGAAEDRLEDPYCLYERVPGLTVPDRPDSLSVDLLASVCEEAGRHLGTLHGVATFDRFGPLVPDDGAVSVLEGRGDWLPLFRRAVETKADAVDDRFADLRALIRAYARGLDEQRLAPAPLDAAPVHMDYRPANLVLDPDRATVTRAVLDWSGAAAAPPAYELAHAETLLTEWPRLGAEARQRLRARFRRGYGTTGDVPPIPDAFRVDARLRLLKHFGTETRALDASATEERAGEHRTALESLGVTP